LAFKVRRAGRASGGVLLALLASCTVGPIYRPPATLTGIGPAPDLLESKSAGYSKEPPPGEWWRLYDAPVLDALIAKALLHNTDLRTALASLEAAQATLRVTELERTPRTSANVDTTFGQGSADEKGAPAAQSPGAVYAASQALSYNFDLFGRLKHAIEADAANVDASRAALDLARVNVAGSVAQAYATACGTGNQIVVTRRSIDLASHIASVTERRFRGGVTGINDLVRARALLAQTRVGLPNLVGRQRASLFLLATLTGDAPEAIPGEVETCTTPPIIGRPLPVGDGISMLRRRPDVRQAERRLAASVAEIGVATGALYPSVTLGAQFGTAATRPGDIVRDRAFKWSVGPLISWSFPNLASARAGIAQTNAAARGSLALFDGTVLTALRETETGLSLLARQLDTVRDLQDARDQSAIAARNTERLYAGGIGQFIDTLDAERTLIQTDAALAEGRVAVSDRQIQLFLALGGGWQNAPVPIARSLEGASPPR
jgi:multidrug efflux system outer membrane protein